MKKNWMKKALLLALVAMLLLSTTVSALAVGRSTTLAKKGARYIVYCNRLNFRAGASIDSTVRKVLRKGTKVTFLKDVRGWWYVKLSNGSKGYVDKQYLTPKHVPKPGWYITTQKLNLRAAPRSGAKLLKTIKKYASIKIDAVNGDWGHVKYSGKSGWVALKYVERPEESTTVAAPWL